MGDVHNSVTGTVHGDVTQAGRDAVRGHHAPDALAAVDELRAALASLGHTWAARRTAEHELDIIEHELRQPDPDKAEVTRRLTRFKDLVRDAGNLVASSAGVARAIAIIAGWLGP